MELFNKCDELYTRTGHSYEEKLYEYYVEMNNVVNEFIGMKYGKQEDKLLRSNEFKQGFIAGLKIMSSIFLDM